MDVLTLFHQKIIAILTDLQNCGHLPSPLPLEKVSIDIPKDSSFGDLSTNAAMVLASFAKMSPSSLADLIIDRLKTLPTVESVEKAGPGFINLTLEIKVWCREIKTIIDRGIDYGSSNMGNGKKVNVEYVSANPTGPMHAGHGRNAVFGDVICSLLEKTGHHVTREYYINDAGNQIDILARSAYLRYLQALGHLVEEKEFEGLYPGEYLVQVGIDLAKKWSDHFIKSPEAEWMPPIRSFTLDSMMTLIRHDLTQIGVLMDVYTSEQDILHQRDMGNILDTLEGDIYEGILEKPKGHEGDDWEPRPQTLFRSTKYGDDVDRALKKSNGDWTYFATDIAYHYDKYKRGFKILMTVLGVDHGGYIKRIKAATKAVTKDKATLEVNVCQLVHFLENGHPIKMSKRAGTFIKLSDIIDKVGKDVARFMMLTRRQDMPIEFDFVKVLEQSKDNPVFYVQYAHARACSVLRHGKEMLYLETTTQANLHFLNNKDEIETMKLLCQWPRQIEMATLTREPHRITNYLYDLAATFHALWNKGKENTHLRFIDKEKPEATLARLSLVKAVSIVLASGLILLKVTPLEEMR